MDIINKIKSVLTQPTKFFTNLKREKGIESAFLYLIILFAFSTILSTIVGQLTQAYFTNFLSESLGFQLPTTKYTSGIFFFSTIFGYVLGLLLSFVIAGIIHVWVLIWGGKAPYTKTYQLYVYSHTPSYLFGWIPFVNIFVWIYTLFLLIIGTQKIHKISKTKSVLMYILPVFLILLLFIIGIIFFIVFLKANPNILQEIMSQGNFS